MKVGRIHQFGSPEVILIDEVERPTPGPGKLLVRRHRELFDERKLVPHVGTVLPLEAARRAHEMLAGAPHERGKSVLEVFART